MGETVEEDLQQTAPTPHYSKQCLRHYASFMGCGMSSQYPDRQRYFAHRYCRLLTKTCAAQEIGHVAFVLCVTIAHQEDSKRYKGPVTFYNEQLMPLVGVHKWDSLDNARKRAADAGWLHYEAGNRGQRLPGRYWVTIPVGLDDLADVPCDETQYPTKGEWSESQSPIQYPAKGEPEGERGGEREGEHSTLTLTDADAAPRAGAKSKPHGCTAKRFSPPSLEEVSAYCKERKNCIDPQYWLDYYKSNGWKVGCNSMRDWKASVRCWEKNGFPQGNGAAKPASPVKYRA